jgi:hypothetical protein
MSLIICPLCSKEVNIVAFGVGWIGLCCGTLSTIQRATDSVETNGKDDIARLNFNSDKNYDPNK